MNPDSLLHINVRMGMIPRDVSLLVFCHRCIRCCLRLSLHLIVSISLRMIYVLLRRIDHLGHWIIIRLFSAISEGYSLFAWINTYKFGREDSAENSSRRAAEIARPMENIAKSVLIRCVYFILRPDGAALRRVKRKVKARAPTKKVQQSKSVNHLGNAFAGRQIEARRGSLFYGR